MNPKLEEVVLTIAEPQETNFFGYAKGQDHPNLNKSEEFFQYYLNLFIPNNVRLKLIYIKGVTDLNKLLTQIDKEQDIIFFWGEEAKEQITSVKEDITALYEKFNKADLICGMHATSINKDKKKKIFFACEWIWNNDKKLIEIIHKHDEYSSETLRQFYKELLAKEQNKHTQPQSDTCKPSQGGFFSESNTNATRHCNESGFTISRQSEMATL